MFTVLKQFAKKFLHNMGCAQWYSNRTNCNTTHIKAINMHQTTTFIPRIFLLPFKTLQMGIETPQSPTPSPLAPQSLYGL